MIHFRLGAFGYELLDVTLGAVPQEAPAVRLTLDTPTTQGDGCFFAQTAEDVAWDTALPGCDDDCDNCCEGAEPDSEDE